jgi:heme/copper-type cytochrome/quinol oxidase subunit 1
MRDAGAVLRHAWWVLAVVLMVGGLAVVLTAPSLPGDAGWFAYTPLDDSGWNTTWGGSGTGSAVFVSRQQVVGWGVAAVGLLVLAAGIGYRVGRRAGRG